MQSSAPGARQNKHPPITARSAAALHHRHTANPSADCVTRSRGLGTVHTRRRPVPSGLPCHRLSHWRHRRSRGPVSSLPRLLAPSMAANPIVSADDYSSQWEAKFWGKEGGLKAGDFFDTAGASPALTHLLASGGVDLAGKRAFIPGCGRGYDVIAFLRAGAAESVGLELAPTAQREAQQYLEEQLTEEEWARAQVFAGDFFTWQHPSVPTWDVGYDYTFFCALHPSMRQDWAAGWARLLAPGSRLVCLAFPLDHGTQTGPPWPVAVQDYRQLLEPVGFVLESEETVPPERSHSKRKNKECMLVFQRQ